MGALWVVCGSIRERNYRLKIFFIYLGLLVVTCGYYVCSVTRYCMTLCCVRRVWLPPLPGGYLWLPALPYIAGPYAVYMEYWSNHSYLCLASAIIISTVDTLHSCVTLVTGNMGM